MYAIFTNYKHSLFLFLEPIFSTGNNLIFIICQWEAITHF